MARDFPAPPGGLIVATIGSIGVIGAGLAGLAAALAAAQAGVAVELFEAEAGATPVAAAIDVVPNLLRDLVALGLGAACVRRGFPYQGMDVVDGDGRQQFRIATPALAGAAHPAALGMAYADLLALLRDAVAAQGVHLQAGTPVQHAAPDGTLRLADGRVRRFDLVLRATGAPRAPDPHATPDVTTTTHNTNPTTTTTTTTADADADAPLPLSRLPQHWCHALLPRPPALARATWVIGQGGAKAQLVPVDAHRAGIALLRPAGAATTPAALRAALAAQGRLLQSLAPHWRDDTPVWLRPVHSGLLPGPWHDGRLLRIGHSAHVLPPHFGQAAAQTVEDAVVLGDLLRHRLPRPELLQAFTQRRADRAREVHALVTQAARWDLHPEAGTDLQALAERLAPVLARAA